MIEPGVRPCPQHRGEPADNCGPCRSERIASPWAEPERWPRDPFPRRRRRALRMPRQAHRPLELATDEDDE